jgi:hypothetical protein
VLVNPPQVELAAATPKGHVVEKVGHRKLADPSKRPD